MTLVGKSAPHFELDGVLNGEIKKFALPKGKWIVLVFYPRSFTGVCNSEVKAYSDEFEKIKKLGADVLAISTDSPFVHQAWLKSDLPEVKYPVLADTTHEVSRHYGVLADNGAALRATFIIDPEGKVMHESVNFFTVGRSVLETTRVLSALQTGQFCDANWKPKH